MANCSSSRFDKKAAYKFFSTSIFLDEHEQRIVK